MKIFKQLFLFSLVGGLFLISCTKDTPVVNNESEIENYEVEDEIAVETFSEDLENIIDDELDFADIFLTGDTKHGLEKGPDRTDVNANCASRTASADRGVYPNTVTITLTEGCQGRFGQSTTGTITVTLTANPRTEGAKKIVTLSDLQVGEVTINGERTITNMGRNDAQRPMLHRSDDMTYTRGDFSFSRSSNVTTTFMNGDDTDTRDDDSLERTGTIEGENSRGQSYSTTTISPMVRKGNCRWPVSGVKEITRGDKKITLDYGDGTCDNLVTASIGDRSKEFEIK